MIFKKTILLLTFAILPALLMGSTERPCVAEDNETMVWICDSENAYAYHTDQYCKGLGRCKCKIKQVTLKKAKEMGKNRPCKHCH